MSREISVERAGVRGVNIERAKVNEAQRLQGSVHAKRQAGSAVI